MIRRDNINEITGPGILINTDDIIGEHPCLTAADVRFTVAANDHLMVLVHFLPPFINKGIIGEKEDRINEISNIYKTIL
jgi:hypothetical protein